ncbi:MULTISPECIES: hypothetical protein [Methylobacter]|uniref:hypothetical protein n=1 Tax=Methylobacter TaxID=429 RepID=UPI00036DD63B|nr:MULTISPECIES: hypothetical protein [Methylobacter]
MKSLRVIGLFAGLLFASFAQADFRGHYASDYRHYGRHGDWIDGHQQQHQRQIEKGIRRGQLSPREVKNLRKQQQKIARLESRFKRDGVLTRPERTILKRKLNQVSGRISALSRNDQYDRYGRRY